MKFSHYNYLNILFFILNGLQTLETCLSCHSAQMFKKCSVIIETSNSLDLNFHVPHHNNETEKNRYYLMVSGLHS